MKMQLNILDVRQIRTVKYTMECLRHIFILGGEPFEPANQRGLIPLLKAVKENYPAKDIWCFTGYLFDEDIMDKMYDKYPETREMLSYIDVCVDGRFVEELKDMMLKFKGSSNQRTILVQQSLKEGTVITAEEYQ